MAKRFGADVPTAGDVFGRPAKNTPAEIAEERKASIAVFMASHPAQVAAASAMQYIAFNQPCNIKRHRSVPISSGASRQRQTSGLWTLPDCCAGHTSVTREERGGRAPGNFLCASRPRHSQVQRVFTMTRPEIRVSRSERPNILRGAILLILFPTSLFSGTLTRNEADAFVRALLWQKASLHSWFDAGNLAASHRLGIEYEGVGNKNLIAYDIDDSLKLMVRDRRLGYSVAVDTLHDAYARLVLTIGKADITRMFYFKGAKCISPLAYITRDWTRVESKHFRIFLSDSTLFNIYCVGRLESFLTRVAALLGLRDRDMQTLQKEKIYYYLCKDEDEIQRLTGFRARGMCNLAYDAVITTYNNHEHELMHLLVNYRLRRLPLYTHPMLQEGIKLT